MTSATEELRKLLDERGVEWVDTGDGSTLIPAQTATNVAWDVNTWPSGKDMGDCLWVQNRHPLTPEQAIAATLGGSDVSAMRAKVKAQSDYISKLRGEYKALDEQMECRCAEYHATIRKLKAELDAVTLGSEREKALEELVRDMWFWGYEGHMDSESQDWHMKHIDGVLDRMKELGIEVDDVRD